MNSFSGGFNTAATIVVQSFSIFDFTEASYDSDGDGTTTDTEANTVYDNFSASVKMVNIIDGTAPASPTDLNNPKGFGKVLGKVFTQFFNVQVPDVQYQSYA